jgi:hypothetical protein
VALESKVFGADAGVVFYHRDGKQSLGHSIQLCIDADDNGWSSRPRVETGLRNASSPPRA